ncbi:MAG: hypothetical protein JSR17_10415 [Proteobacteria bacterium]|nr:hypothetical protein [Pseudomonadota bacterium]
MLGNITLKGLGKGSLDLFEQFMALIGVYYTSHNVKDLFGKELGEKYTLKSRLAIFLFYLIHIVALVLATGFVGEYLLSASMASLLVNMTTLINDLYELIQETYSNHKRNRELNDLKAELESQNVSYEQNALILRDLIELKQNVNFIKQQKQELEKLLVRLDSLNNQNPPDYYNNLLSNMAYADQLAAVVKSLSDKENAIINEHEVIGSFIKIHGNNIDELAVIKEKNAEIKKLQEEKFKLKKKIHKLFNQRIFFSDDEKENKRKIKAIDAKIRDCTCIAQFFFKKLKAKNALHKVSTLIDNLDAKYKGQLYQFYPEHQIAVLKAQEREYLFEKKIFLRKFIFEPFHSNMVLTRDKAKTDELTNAQWNLALLRKEPKCETLKKYINDRLAQLNSKIQGQQLEVQKRQKLIQQISGNPKREIKQDFDKLYKITNRINELDKEIQLSALEKTHKLWSTYISTISAVLSISLSFFSMQLNVLFESLGKLTDVLEALSKLFSVFGAVVGLVASNHKNVAVIMRQYEQDQQAKLINSEFRNKANIITDVDLQRECVDIISRCSQDESKTYLPSKQPKKRSKAYHDNSRTVSEKYQFSI